MKSETTLTTVDSSGPLLGRGERINEPMLPPRTTFEHSHFHEMKKAKQSYIGGSLGS
jgi:hypothetical protein